MKKVSIRAQYSLSALCTEFYVFDPEQKKEQETVSPILPTYWMEDNCCQALIDDLWKAGYRPAEAKGSAGQLEATERHLKDMRTLAFHNLNITDRG